MVSVNVKVVSGLVKKIRKANILESKLKSLKKQDQINDCFHPSLQTYFRDGHHKKGANIK